MSVLIRGMEMPSNTDMAPTAVWVYPNGYAVVFKDNGKMQQYTQAVPVPPHGRLGDLDALVDWLKLSYGTSIPIVRGLLFSSIIKEIQEYPSVIPAEEVET